MENLLNIILIQYQMIVYLCFLTFGQSYKGPKLDKIIDKKYLKLSVDPLPVFEKPEPTKIYDGAMLIVKNSIKPIRSRRGKAVSFL